MKNLIFVGAEAYGYYSEAYACEGVFLSKEMYEKHEELLKSTFSERYFHELDGKHSQVNGDLVVNKINSEFDVYALLTDDCVSCNPYLLEEYIEDDVEGIEDLLAHVNNVYELIQKESEGYSKYTFVLTTDEHAEVETLIKKLREGLNN